MEKFKTQYGLLYHADYNEVINNLPKVDLVLTDPPYNISRKTNFDSMKDRRHGRSMEYGEWDYNFNLDFAPILNLIKPNGSIVTFLSFEQYDAIFKQLSENNFIIKDRLIWEKTNPFPRNRDRRYVPNIELIIWATRKNAKWIFNRQSDTYERCVFRYPSESGATFKRYHPTQKPLELVKYLIKIHSNENDLVLDPFAGSGTTALACEHLQRRWICIEKSRDYFDIIKHRLKMERGLL